MRRVARVPYSEDMKSLSHSEIGRGYLWVNDLCHPHTVTNSLLGLAELFCTVVLSTLWVLGSLGDC